MLPAHVISTSPSIEFVLQNESPLLPDAMHALDICRNYLETSLSVELSRSKTEYIG